MTALDARSAAIAAIVAMVVFCSLNVAHCKSFYTNRDLPKNGEWIPMGNDGSGFMQAADSELIQYMRNHHGRTLQQENKNTAQCRKEVSLQDTILLRPTLLSTVQRHFGRKVLRHGICLERM